MAGVFDALDLLSAIRAGRQGTDEYLHAFVHFGKSGSRTGKSVRRDKLIEHFRKVMDGEPQADGNVAIAAVFFRPNHQRIDADNQMKLVLDAATQAGVWHDDSQVTAQASIVEYDEGLPRTVIAWGPAASSLHRTGRADGLRPAVCPRCGKTFSYRGLRPRKYCSRSCAQPAALRRCARCGREFHRLGARTASGRRYCSRACAALDPLRRQKVASSRPRPTCSVCGGPVSRREYTRCATCSGVGRPIGARDLGQIPPALGDEICRRYLAGTATQKQLAKEFDLTLGQVMRLFRVRGVYARDIRVTAL